MASIRSEIIVGIHPDMAWDAVRDVGQIHVRLVPGFVTDCRLEDGARIVTFGNGMQVRELIVDVDELARRVAWAAVGGQFQHHNASLQVFADGIDRTRLAWIADLLPHELAEPVRAMIEQGMAAMQRTLEQPT